MSDTPSRPTQEQLERYAELFNQSQTMRFFGLRVSFPQGEKVVITLPEVRPEHRGGLGTAAINGGVLAAMFHYARCQGVVKLSRMRWASGQSPAID
jgi:hypothetical protein